jgi:hypothetical protein
LAIKKYQAACALAFENKDYSRSLLYSKTAEELIPFMLDQVYIDQEADNQATLSSSSIHGRVEDVISDCTLDTCSSSNDSDEQSYMDTNHLHYCEHQGGITHIECKSYALKKRTAMILKHFSLSFKADDDSNQGVPLDTKEHSLDTKEHSLALVDLSCHVSNMGARLRIHLLAFILTNQYRPTRSEPLELNR